MLGDMHIGARASDLLDGRLSAAEEQELRLHVGHCVRCAHLVQAEQQVRTLLRGAAPADLAASEEFLSGLLQMPQSFAPPQRQPRLGRRMTVGLLTVGAAVSLGVGAPLAAGAGPAVMSMLPGLQPQSRTPAARIVMVPAGPRAGAHTTVRFAEPEDPPSSP